MLRRVVLLTACVALFTGSAPASYGRDIIERLLYPLIHGHKRGSSKKSSSSHSQVVWAGLVIAENVEKPEKVPSELAKFEQTLKDLFGYNQFHVIGESRKSLRSGQEDWLAASKHFALHVDAKGPSEGGYVLKLQLVQRDREEQHPPHSRAAGPSPETAASAAADASPGASPVGILLETETRLSRRSPLVIKGPQVGGGQLLLVMVIQ